MNVIEERYKLPSLGKAYKKDFDPEVTLRSMTVADEMKRLGTSNKPYKNMAEMIDSCITNKLPISSYDMIVGDYSYLLQKLRITTYGTEYQLAGVCPRCGDIDIYDVDLDKMEVREWNDSIKELMSVKLPKCGDEIKLRLQTPRDLDYILNEEEELRKSNPDSASDYKTLLHIETIIDSINGEKFDRLVIRDYVNKLHMADATKLVQRYTKISDKVGIAQDVKVECKNAKCNHTFSVPFRINKQFFGPDID